MPTAIIVIGIGIIALAIFIMKRAKPTELLPKEPKEPVADMLDNYGGPWEPEGVIVADIVITNPTVAGCPPEDTFGLGNYVRIVVCLQAPEDAIYPLSISGALLINNRLVRMNTVIGAPTGREGSLMYMPPAKGVYTVKSQAQEATFTVV